MKSGKAQKIIFVFMFLLVTALITPVGFRVAEQYGKQNLKQQAYQFINKASIKSQTDEYDGPQIFQIKDGKIESVLDDNKIDVKDVIYNDGFIVVDEKGQKSFQMSTDNECIIKESSATDVTYSNDCENIQVGSSIVELDTVEEVINDNINVVVGSVFELPSIHIGKKIKYFNIQTTITLNGQVVDKIDTTTVGNKYKVVKTAVLKRNERVKFEKVYTVTIIEDVAQPLEEAITE